MSVKTKGVITGNKNGLTKGELRIVNDLANSGNNVQIISKDPKSIDKTYDFIVNGVSTELKTLSNANVSTGVKRIQQGFKQNNPSVVIIDTRGTGMTTTQAQQMIDRASGTYDNKKLPGQVHVWTDEGIVTGGQ